MLFEQFLPFSLQPWGSMAIGTSLYTDTPEEEGDRVRVGDGCTENSSGRGSEGQNMARNWDGSDKPIDKPKEVKKAGLFGFFRSSSDYPKKGSVYILLYSYVAMYRKWIGYAS